jgi:hypothetical protein
MINKKKIILITMIVGVILNMFCINISDVFAADSDTTYISLSDSNITVNDNNISNDTSEDVYLTQTMNNGGSSEDATNANIEITNVININNSGIYEFTGSLSDGQISVNSNKVNGDVTIILNNVDITCENAPAIFVYNSETDSSTCNITIKTAEGSTNTISGGKIKQSVEGWSDQSEILYYIDKGYDDDNKYYERYKYDGAISSDISLTFEGEGNLIVNALSKEGIETKRDITINSGNYVINSLDDGINACTDNESIITINGGTILVNVESTAEEGDGIDSNGYIYINGGTVYAFASETSQDNGLDSDSGTYINGGTVVATGNMGDTVSTDSQQSFMQMQFNDKVQKDTLITITDENNNPITAFKSDRAYQILTISTPDFTDGEHYVYEGGSIEGTSENGLYTEITSYTVGTEKEYSTVSDMGNFGGFDKDMKDMNINGQNDSIYYYTIIILAIVLIIFIVFVIILKKKGEFEMKGKILTLCIGILIGAIIGVSGFMIYNKVTASSEGNQGMMNGQMQGGGEMPDGEKPDGEMPDGEMPDGEKPDGKEMNDGEKPEMPSQEQSESNNNV